VLSGGVAVVPRAGKMRAMCVIAQVACLEAALKRCWAVWKKSCVYMQKVDKTGIREGVREGERAEVDQTGTTDRGHVPPHTENKRDRERERETEILKSCFARHHSPCPPLLLLGPLL
jgi:hypothetical protein